MTKMYLLFGKLRSGSCTTIDMMIEDDEIEHSRISLTHSLMHSLTHAIT
jgi:hypothetical protein